MPQKHEFSYRVMVELCLEHEEGKPHSNFKYCDVYLKTYPPLQAKVYEDAAGAPNGAGIKLSTIALISGLSNNIHRAHEAGFWDSAEHLRYIIAELEKQFVQVPEIEIKNGK